jgi:hypothetical protein
MVSRKNMSSSLPLGIWDIFIGSHFHDFINIATSNNTHLFKQSFLTPTLKTARDIVTKHGTLNFYHTEQRYECYVLDTYYWWNTLWAEQHISCHKIVKNITVWKWHATSELWLAHDSEVRSWCYYYCILRVAVINWSMYCYDCIDDRPCQNYIVK